MIVAMLTDVYIPIKWLERRVAQQNLMWGRFSDCRRDGTCMVPRYQAKSFMFRGNCFVVTILSHNITTNWVGRKQRMLEKVAG